MGFLDSILGFFGDVGGELLSIVAQLFNFVIAALQYLWSFLAAFGQLVLNIFKSVITFLAHLWDGFFSNIFVRVFNALLRFGDWLSAHLAALLEWLQRAQRYILNLYTRYVRPILVMIQRVRQVLQILRAFHIKWAQDLDNILAHVQSDINGIFLKITGTLNAVIDVINIITDPARLLRHPTLILSIRRSFLALIRQLTGLPPGFWLPSGKANIAQGVKPIPKHFNPNDPLQNPPASYYMGLDDSVPSLGFLASGQEVPADIGDDVPGFDFLGQGDLLPDACDDLGFCFVQAVDSARAKA